MPHFSYCHQCETLLSFSKTRTPPTRREQIHATHGTFSVLYCEFEPCPITEEADFLPAAPVAPGTTMMKFGTTEVVNRVLPPFQWSNSLICLWQSSPLQWGGIWPVLRPACKSCREQSARSMKVLRPMNWGSFLYPMEHRVQYENKDIVFEVLSLLGGGYSF
jgi:hypothetical protein